MLKTNFIRTYLWVLLLLGLTGFQLLLLPPPPIRAQELQCPVTVKEWQRRCRSAEETVARMEDELVRLQTVMSDPDIILVKADRISGESAVDYKIRVERKNGVRSPASNTWLPIIEHYYLPDRGMAIVAMKRTDYWLYVGEALGFDTPEALNAFRSQETLGLDIRLSSFLGPQGRIAGMQADIDRLKRFLDNCCTKPPETPSTETPPIPFPPPADPENRPLTDPSETGPRPALP